MEVDMIHRKLVVAFCVLCVLVAVTSSCTRSADKDLTGEAVVVAEAWLGVVDRGEYGVSWDQSAEVFQAAVSKANWDQTMTAMRRPLGDLISRSVQSAKYATSLPGAPDGEYVVVQFTTGFSDKESAVETVTPMKGSDGVWRVSGYFIK
jgi:hypothetical protein